MELINTTGFNKGDTVILTQNIDGRIFKSEEVIENLYKVRTTDVVFVYFVGTAAVATLDEIEKIKQN